MYFVKTPQILKALWPTIIWDCPADKPEFHLSFDDGPSPETPYILDALAEHDCKAVFFCLGRQIEKYPDIFTQMKEEGHTIGNHGYAHLDGWKVNTVDYLNDVRKGFELSGSHLFRPAYGRMRWTQYKRLREDHKIVMWSVMPGDFDPAVSDSLLRKRLANVTKQDIVVLHDRVGVSQRLEGIL